jgi:hypothetical protein
LLQTADICTELTAVNGQSFLPVGGQWFCPSVAIRNAQ